MPPPQHSRNTEPVLGFQLQLAGQVLKPNVAAGKGSFERLGHPGLAPERASYKTAADVLPLRTNHGDRLRV